ncbi:hypothetical protein, partial [Bacteroides uniformis]
LLLTALNYSYTKVLRKLGNIISKEVCCPIFIFFSSKPINEILISAFFETDNVNLPSISVIVPLPFLFSSTMLAPIIGSPLLSFTTPVILILSCREKYIPSVSFAYVSQTEYAKAFHLLSPIIGIYTRRYTSLKNNV